MHLENGSMFVKELFYVHIFLSSVSWESLETVEEVLVVRSNQSGSWFLIILQQIELELLRERDGSKTDQETYIQVSL